MATKKFIYGIAVVKFNSKEIGYIEKGSWDWGGTKPESTDVEAEQEAGGTGLGEGDPADDGAAAEGGASR